MEKSPWFEVELRVAPAMKEAVVNRLFEWGAQGVAEEDVEDESHIRAFFEAAQRDVVEDEIEAYVQSILPYFPGISTGATRVAWQEIEPENWAEAHRKFYPAQKITRLFFLKPAWDDTTAVPDGMLPLVMEPGQAFGTGLHATTRLCMRLIEYFVEMHPKPSTLRALDVGTGTGILAMALCKLGVESVLATDNDPVALDVAAHNLEINQCARVQLTDEDLSEVDASFDLIVSNILLSTHQALVAQYRRLLSPGGHLVLSGLLAHQKADAVEAMAALGFVLEAEEASQDWIALAFAVPLDLHSS